MASELSENGDWEAVRTVVYRQMKSLGMSIASLSRESGVSENTIRYIGRREKRHRSTLVALSATLGCQHDYLVKILEGEADPADLPRAPAEAAFIGNLLRHEVGPLKEEVSGLAGVIHQLDDKVTHLFDQRRKE